MLPFQEATDEECLEREYHQLSQMLEVLGAESDHHNVEKKTLGSLSTRESESTLMVLVLVLDRC